MPVSALVAVPGTRRASSTSYDETAEGDLVLPRGLHALLTELVDSAGSMLRIDDNRAPGDRHEFTFTTQLRTEQTTAVRQLVEQDTSVLIAKPGTGRTVIACAAIASRATSTLILVDRKALADQWRDRLQKHLGFKCGQIGGGRSKTTGIIDIALLPTLARRASVEDITVIRAGGIERPDQRGVAGQQPRPVLPVRRIEGY